MNPPTAISAAAWHYPVLCVGPYAAPQGYCVPNRSLVFEYVSGGNLEDWLSGRYRVTQGRPFGWRARLLIALQVRLVQQWAHLTRIVQGWKGLRKVAQHAL